MEICLLKDTPDSMGNMRGTGLDLVGSLSEQEQLHSLFW